jgi:NhaP-type Na+/H+ or K+/H+ antiporter
MHFNVGSADRVIRILVGLALLVLPFVPGMTVFANPIAFWGALLVGAILVVTGAVRFCPLYSIFGLSTRKVPNR